MDVTPRSRRARRAHRGLPRPPAAQPGARRPDRRGPAGGQSPLRPRALLEELRVWGEHFSLDERIEHYLAASTIDGLYELILTRYEEDYEREPTRPRPGRDVAALGRTARPLRVGAAGPLGADGGPLPRAVWSPLGSLPSTPSSAAPAWSRSPTTTSAPPSSTAISETMRRSGRSMAVSPTTSKVSHSHRARPASCRGSLLVPAPGVASTTSWRPRSSSRPPGAPTSSM